MIENGIPYDVFMESWIIATQPETKSKVHFTIAFLNSENHHKSDLKPNVIIKILHKL